MFVIEVDLVYNGDMKISKNYAFIDGNNLYLGAKSQGIKLDYRKLRLYLTHKFNVAKAIIFIGYDPERTALYADLYNAGFVLVQKPTVKYYENGWLETKNAGIRVRSKP